LTSIFNWYLVYNDIWLVEAFPHINMKTIGTWVYIRKRSKQRPRPSDKGKVQEQGWFKSESTGRKEAKRGEKKERQKGKGEELLRVQAQVCTIQPLRMRRTHTV